MSKSIDQIFRYTSDCRFPDDDWQKVLAYCRENFKGGKIHKAIRPKSQSTYQEFIEWIENGLGYGDYVRYGKTMGIIGLNTAHETHLMAYLDYEKNLVINDMKVRDPERIVPLDPEGTARFMRLMYDADKAYYVRTNSVDQIYTPQKYSYVSVVDDKKDISNVGMYLESDGCRHHYAALLSHGKLKMDCWVDSEYTPFKAASEAEVQRLHHAASKEGWSFNERTKSFVKQPRNRGNNMYWYINDRFEILMDKDNRSKIHTERFNVGNYFLDRTEAVLFVKEIKNLRGKA